MALNIKNAEAERLAADVARLTGESKTEAIRRALAERRQRLKNVATDVRRRSVLRFLRKKVWPRLPKQVPWGIYLRISRKRNCCAP